MKRAVALGALLLALLAFTPSVKAQTTYTQTTRACVLTQCTDAEFTPTATLSYDAFFVHCGDQNVKFFVTWNGVEYSDGKASMIFIGHEYNGKNYTPWAVWELRGTANNGTITVVEHVATYGGCAGGHNLDGSVTTPAI